MFVCLSVCVSLSLISPFSLFSILSPLSFLFYILSLCPFPSLFYPFPHLSLPSPLILSLSQSTPLRLVSLYSLLPSLFSLLSLSSPFFFLPIPFSPFNFLCLPFCLFSPICLLYIFSSLSLLSLLFSPFSTSLPFSSLHSFFRYPLPSVYLIFIFSPIFCPLSSPFSVFSLLSPLPFSSPFLLLSILFPLRLSISTPFCVSSSFSFLSLSSLSNFSPFSLLSSPLFTVFCLSPLHSLSSPISLFSFLSPPSFLSLLFLSISSPLCPFSPISFLLSPPYFTSPFSLSYSVSLLFLLSDLHFSHPFFPLSIISLISSLNSLSSLPLSLLQYLCLSSTPFPSIIRYPLILSLDTLTSVSPLHCPSSLFSLISLLFLPLSLRHFLFFLSIFSILCLLPDLSPLHSLNFLLSPTLLHPCLLPAFSSRGLEGKWGGRKAGG